MVPAFKDEHRRVHRAVFRGRLCEVTLERSGHRSQDAQKRLLLFNEGLGNLGESHI